jgi:hypothetical protein
MNRIMKFAMAAVIALVSGSAQAQVTGRTVLDANTNLWQAAGPYSNATDATTGTFHAGGVAACDGCHVMHNASNGAARSTKTAPWTDAVPAFLLQGTDQSSTCLMCHGSATFAGTATPYVMTTTSGTVAGINYTPGGDFGWLKITGNQPSGNNHGHNVAAADFGFAAESGRIAPGGTYAAGSGTGQFACSSCHDPHGRYRMQGAAGNTWVWAGPDGSGLAAINQPIYSSGSYGNLPDTTKAIGTYRLLAGKGYTPASNITSPTPFPNNAPVAVAPPAYNKTEAGARTNEVRVAYGSGMSEWCQNCHTNIHLDNYVSGAMGASGLRHPAGQGAILKPGQYDVYNKYVSSGKFQGSGDLYTSLVPFENAAKIPLTATGGASADITKLKNAALGADSAGIFVASGQSNVMCLSCHRAHASAFSSMVRWNADDTFITNGTSAFVDTQNRGAAVLKAAYYDRNPADLGAFQRSLCNKCHGKD